MCKDRIIKATINAKGTENDLNYKPIEFDGFINEAGKNSFILSSQTQIISEVAAK